MLNLKNPFGMRNGKIVMIGDIPLSERGLKCGCVCPACEEPFEARLGNVRTHHFAHSGKGCDEENAYLTGLYLLVQEHILNNRIELPELNVFWAYRETPYSKQNFFERVSFSKSARNRNCTTVAPPMSIRFESAEIRSNDRRPEALLLSYQSHQMALCIAPPPNVCKRYLSKPYRDLATVQLNTEEIPFGSWGKQDILGLLGTLFPTSCWLYSPKAIRALDRINETNDVWIEELRRQREQRLLLEQDHRENAVRRAKQQMDRVPQASSSDRMDPGQKPAHEKDAALEAELKQGYREVAGRFTQQVEQIRDSYGRRWLQCTVCGKIIPEHECPSYGGPNRVNSGICADCTGRRSPKR